MSTTNLMRRALLAATIGIAVLTPACDEQSYREPPYKPRRYSVPRGDRSKVPTVTRSSYIFQISEQTFNTVLKAVQFEEERGNFQIYRGKIDSVSEKDGTIASAMLAVEGRDDTVFLSLGEGSYQVTDGVYEKNHTGLFDPRGKPLSKENCQQGDEVTAIAWKKDFPWDDQLTCEPILIVPVRAFRNQTKNLQSCSAELLRYFRIGHDVMY